ncbi:type-F conjugative transfer system mating-pair stabilization protein TraN (plasmid) [Enterobacter hormaechei]|uniref:Type-F conjugative transfer system mating-pair stabilization protein TraN n=23 Tax=Enterobacteriaceae TaxID=543 RepID=A0A9P3Z9Q1_CITFR|nr:MULTISPECIES: type-F conjugative transfer system mating-pair stabilization protein TraN [Enterobacterales]EKV8810469.1 type-F conjugative transfer system mating-pair stabilization protein TraN [Klebsiella aerogenes]QAR67942.1 type-F conjugative transfer system mating-pair stabilization protein TraN [Citrobacter sp. SL156]HBQ2550204.1 type-F conjugative transfer system mating-pair stabilization protein TraN [Klebsiella variicola]HBV8118311.1 type-F conjugative transfer system mating-pair stab
MKRAILMSVLAIATTMASVNAFADADAQYRAGADFARQVQGQGESSLKNFNPSASIPNYTASPGEKKYYGGVTATGDGALKADGTTGWTTNEATKAVTDSFVNNPKEPISPDAPFIKASQDVQSRADTIIGKTGQTQCEAQNISRSEFTNYTCERDLLVEQACTRTASITGHYEDTSETKQIVIQSQNISFASSEAGYTGTWTAPVTGKVVAATATYSWNKRLAFSNPNWFMRVTTPFGLISMDNDTGSLALSSGMQLKKGAGMVFSIRTRRNNPTTDSIWKHSNMRYSFTVTLQIEIPAKKWVPDVVWNESCPFSKSEGTLKKTECIEPGSTKTVVVDGVSYPVTQACWKYKDTYMTQAADNGTCKTYMNNPACTLASRTCAFTAEDGSGCLHEYATYSCETRTSGQVMICGGDTFCLDGDCERAQNGKNNDFAPVVSALAALAAAGKDVAAINSVNVRAFTGSAKFCKKFAAGFSSCCKDGGWGQDVGLARCSSEEKALGKAKENKLTVSIGEFCSKKVLGVCLEKKRSYCQFDSKLAQIVQQQGRNGQLHIGFGKASSPDCRGITQTELQQIKFDKLDFSNFFDDLQKNKKIPDNDTLTKRVREEIAAQLKNKQ